MLFSIQIIHILIILDTNYKILIMLTILTFQRKLGSPYNKLLLKKMPPNYVTDVTVFLYSTTMIAVDFRCR